MNSIKWFLFSVLIFFILFSNSSALLATVSIVRANGNTDGFYSFEKAEYNIIIVNNEPMAINGFKLKASAQDGLQIIGGNEKPAREKEFIAFSIPAGETHTETITLSGSENLDKEYKIFIDYGISEYNYRVETGVKVKKNPAEFNAFIENFSPGEGEKNAVLIDFKNDSSGKIYDIKIELQPNDSIEIKSEQVLLNEMSQNEGISQRRIEFINLEKISAPLELEVKAEFSDETGKHELSKKITAKEPANMLLIALVLLVLLAVGFWFVFFSKKKPAEKGSGKKHESPEAHGSNKGEHFPSLEEEKRKLMNE